MTPPKADFAKEKCHLEIAKPERSDAIIINAKRRPIDCACGQRVITQMWKVKR